MTVMETAIRRGLRLALAGGAGIASGDALWAAVAAGTGGAQPAAVTVGDCAAVDCRRRARGVPGVRPGATGASYRPSQCRRACALPVRAYGEFLVHTLRHPATVIFFMRSDRRRRTALRSRRCRRLCRWSVPGLAGLAVASRVRRCAQGAEPSATGRGDFFSRSTVCVPRVVHRLHRVGALPCG